MASNTDSEEESLPTLEELQKWKVVDLKKWLEIRGLKKSGNKRNLINRVYRAQQNGLDTDESTSSDSENCEIPFRSYDELSDSGWKCADMLNLPNIEKKDIDNYFLFQKNPTSGNKLRFQRHLVKAKRLSNEGFIRDVEYHDISEDAYFCYIRAKCMPSMRSTVNVGNNGKQSSHYNLYTCIVKSTGKVNNSYCNCKAGVAGLCAHVGALLFSVCKIKNACTSLECSWDKPKPIKNKPSPKKIFDINFSRTDKEEIVTKAKPYPGVYKAGPCQDPDTFLSELLDGLESIYPECVLYQTLRAKPINIDSFTELFSPNFMFHDNTDLKADQCKQTFEKFFDELKVSDTMCDELEVATRGQAINENWKKARGFLLTASEFGDICKRQKNEPDGLVKRVCGYIEIPDNVRSVCHGKKSEPKGFKSYMSFHKEKCGVKNVDVQQKGLRLNPKYPFLGASVDGFVVCKTCGPGLIEIKCPYGKKNSDWKNLKPEECGVSKDFFCEVVDGHLKLKKNHNYMYQIQGQMAVYDLKWVDFIVWTKKGLSVQRVEFDETIWNNMLQKLKNFYVNSVIPEFFTRRVQRGKKLFPGT